MIRDLHSHFDEYCQYLIPTRAVRTTCWGEVKTFFSDNVGIGTVCWGCGVVFD